MTAAPIRQPVSQPIDPIRLERDRHVAFAFAAADLLIEARVDEVILVATGAAQAILGLGAKDLVGKRLGSVVATVDRPLVRRLVRQIKKLGRIDPVAVHLARPDGSQTRILFGGCCLPNLPGSLFLSVTLLPIAATAAPQARDASTGLLTLDGLTQAAQLASQEDGGARQLKLVRLDGLSGAVKQFAPERAAVIMAEIGAVMRATSIGGDTAGRIGDDTFGFVTKQGDDARRDAALVADLSDAMREAGVPDGQVGPRVARIDLKLGDLSDADVGRALSYAVKTFVGSRNGTFTISSLQEGLAAKVNETVTRFAETRRMIGCEEFTLVYQPVVDLPTRSVHHYEALSRFPGKASTYETIVFSEDVGLVAEIDLSVCRRAIAALTENPTVRIAVNLSGRSVQNEAFRGALGEMIRPLKTLRNCLLFELTESAVIDDLVEASAFLRWIRKLEHPLCLDDFGAGASAYSYLRRFDVDFVKIDGPFLKAARDHSREWALIRSISVLCHEINCKVIGEMIEDEPGATIAASLGIDYGQGWLYGKPLPEIPKPVEPGRRKGTTVTWG